jgi:uncharacterized membrane protein YfcA
MPYDAEFMLVAAFVVFLVGLSKSGLATGLSSLAVPLLALFLPPLVAAAILLPLLSVIDAVVIWKYWGKIRKDLVLICLPGGVLGVLVASFTIGSFDPAWIKLIVGLIALWFSGLYYLADWLPRLRFETGAKVTLFLAAISGFSSFFAHSGGPPMRALMLHRGLDKSAYVGTFGTIFAVINGLKVISYTMLGQFSTETLSASLLLSPLVALGILAGLRLHMWINQELFTRFAYAMLLIAGVKLIYDASTTLV